MTAARRIERSSGWFRHVVVGDSILAGMPPEARARSMGGHVPLVAAIGGDRVPNMTWRVRRLRLGGATSVAVLGGINDLANDAAAPALVARRLVGLVETVHAAAPAARVHLIQILPVSGRLAAHAAGIRSVNSLIRGCAATRPWLTLHDLGPALAGADGTARAGLLSDGVHPTPGGYRALARALGRLA